MKTLTEFIGEKDEGFDRKFEGYWRGNAIPDEIKFFMKFSLTERNDYLKKCVGEIDRAVWNDGEGKEMQVYVLLSDVIKILE